MKKIMITVLMLIFYADLYGFADFSFGGKYDLSSVFLPQPVMFAFPFIQSEDKNLGKIGISAINTIGFEYNIGFRVPGNIIGFSFSGAAGLIAGLMLFNEGLTEDFSNYYRLGFNSQGVFYFNFSPFEKDLRKSSFFIGIGNGFDNYFSSGYISGENENLYFSPSTTAYLYYSLGYEKILRRGNIKNIKHHRYGFTVKPEIYTKIGFNSNRTSVKFNIDTNKLIIKSDKLTIAGYPEFQIGFAVSAGFNMDFETFRKDYNIKLSNESILINQADGFNASSLKSDLIMIEVKNNNIYTTHISDDLIIGSADFENNAALYIGTFLNKKYGFKSDGDSYSYTIQFTFDKLNLRKVRGVNIVKHSLESTVYVFEKYTDINGNAAEKIVMEGIIKVEDNIKIPKGYNRPLSLLMSARKESLNTLIDKMTGVFYRDFILPEIYQ